MDQLSPLDLSKSSHIKEEQSLYSPPLKDEKLRRHSVSDGESGSRSESPSSSSTLSVTPVPCDISCDPVKKEDDKHYFTTKRFLQKYQAESEQLEAEKPEIPDKKVFSVQNKDLLSYGKQYLIKIRTTIIN